MALLTVLTLVGIGLAVGLLSGLIGIGGGVLMVPFLYFFYDRPDLFGMLVAPENRTILAHGTSLFVIMPTSVRGVLAYQRTRMVEWRAVVPIGLAAMAAAVLGARLALALPPEALKVGFGLLLLYSGAQMGLRRPPREGAARGEPRLPLPLTLAAGVGIGLFSALLGVGGGIIAIPLLIHLMHLDVRKVAATSMGIIGITAAGGATSYIVSGMGHAGLPPLSAGYVHLPAALLMFVGSVMSVRWGASLNQRIPARTLRMIFAGVFVLFGVELIASNARPLLALAGVSGS